MTARGSVLVTPRSVTQHGHPALQRLTDAGYRVVLGPAGRQPTVDELIAALPECVGYLAGVEPVPAKVFPHARNLRVISRNGTGVDNVDLAAAERHGIVVLRADGANARGVAELTLGLMLALARGVPASDRALKAGAWTRVNGIELEGHTLGLIGCGRVGRLVARLAAAVGLRVVAHDPIAESAGLRLLDAEFAPIGAVFAAADVLSLHCPPLPDGRALVDATALAQMKRGVLIVNTARADLIDSVAVRAALDRGHVGGLALDVFDHEPPLSRELVDHPRVVATPHIGGFTQESVDRAMHAAVDHLLQALAAPSPTTSLRGVS